MKIRFESTIEDWVAFNRFHHANSPTTRRQWFQFFAMVPILLALAGLAGIWITFGAFREDPVICAILWAWAGAMGVGASIAWFFISRRYWASLLERNVRKLFAEGSNRSLLGWREMELVSGRLILKTELLHASMDLRAIERIASTDEYTYVYVASTSAYIIPMNLYPEDEYRQFVEDLRAAWENRGIAQPPVEEAPKRAQPDERIVERPH